MLNGSVRLSSSNEAGEVFEDDLQAGGMFPSLHILDYSSLLTLTPPDVWFFPAGRPHSIVFFVHSKRQRSFADIQQQALETGAEFLLIFDDGSFSDSGTSLVSELFQRIPKSVLAKVCLHTLIVSASWLLTGFRTLEQTSQVSRKSVSGQRCQRPVICQLPV